MISELPKTRVVGVFTQPRPEAVIRDAVLTRTSNHLPRERPLRQLGACLASRAHFERHRQVETISCKVPVGMPDERRADLLANLWRLRVDKGRVARHASHGSRPKCLGTGQTPTEAVRRNADLPQSSGFE